MHLVALTLILVAAAASLGHAQTDLANSTAANAVDHWCGAWAGSPDPRDVPSGGLLPRDDSQKRLFVEPQLQRVPFSPVIGSEARVQVPKLWGQRQFRLALLSYADSTRVYASSKSTWSDFSQALSKLMSTCVSQGTGGAYLVPPSQGLTQSTLVVYVYAVESYFDYQMNYYMTTPYGLNPANIQNDFLASGFKPGADVPSAVL